MRKRYANARSKKKIDTNLIGPCGFYCGYCLAYSAGECLGCRYQEDRKRELGRGVFCTTLVCADRKGVTMCSECEEYPCDEQYDPSDSIFSALYVDYIKNEIRPIVKSKIQRVKKKH